MHREQALVTPQRSRRRHDIKAFDDECIIDKKPHKFGVGERDGEVCRRPRVAVAQESVRGELGLH